MYQLIVAPFLDSFLVLRPGSGQGMKIPRDHFEQLLAAADNRAGAPDWLGDAVLRRWGIALREESADRVVLVRSPSTYRYGRASWELNLGCNYDCEHCYLGLKRFEGLDWDQRVHLLNIMRDSGVVWLQLTGGEPLIDKRFIPTYERAFALGMMLSISTNGSRLWKPEILQLLKDKRPYRLTVSVYGATAASYDKLTKRPGSFAKFRRGLIAAHEASLPIVLNLVVTNANADELDQMIALADGLNLPHHTFANMSPTIYGGPEVLPAQSTQHLTRRKPFTGCNAGHTFYHVDPLGFASICKIGRDPHIALLDEGVDGLCRLGGSADGLLLRQGGCTGCQLQGTCGTCMPMVQLYRKAKAPLSTYCQH